MATAATESMAGTETSTDLGAPFLDASSPGPLRAALLGPDRLVAYAKVLAKACEPYSERSRARPLLKRFRDNSQYLARAQEFISESYQRQHTLGPDADWLLDNFHIV